MSKKIQLSKGVHIIYVIFRTIVVRTSKKVNSIRLNLIWDTDFNSEKNAHFSFTVSCLTTKAYYGLLKKRQLKLSLVEL